MDGKVVLITGANAGIGVATAVAIAKLKPKLYIGKVFVFLVFFFH